MKPLIVGEAPSKNEITERPIEGRIGKRLAALCGLSLEEFLNHFERVNLLHVRQDTADHGFEFDREAARASAVQLMAGWKEDRVILLLGHRVADAFGVRREYFVERRYKEFVGEVRVLPHPSGINRWWNGSANYKDAEAFMRNIVERTR